MWWSRRWKNTGSDISQEVVDAAREELGLDQAISDTVCGLAWRNPARRHGNQLCIRQTSVLYVYFQASGNIAFDSHIYSFDDPYIYSAGNSMAAVYQNHVSDYLIRTLSFIGNSLPNFFVSLLLMYLFAIRLGWFPVIATGVSLKSVAMPAITLAIAMSAKYLRQVRATVLDELSKDYVVGAKARGIKFSRTLWGV